MKNIFSYLYPLQIIKLKQDSIINSDYIKVFSIDDIENIDLSKPFIYCSSTYSKIANEENSLNKFNDIVIASDKAKFHKHFSEYSFLPKSVYNINDIKELKLPIIAKPNDGSSGKGIKVFDSYEISNYNEYDIFSEFKEIDEEYRVFVMNGELLFSSKRHNKNDIKNKEKTAKIEYEYDINIDINSKFINDINNIIYCLESKLDLYLYAIDIMTSKDNEVFVAEVNVAPGLGEESLKIIYEHFVRNVYSTIVPNYILNKF